MANSSSITPKASGSYRVDVRSSERIASAIVCVLKLGMSQEA